MIRGLAAAPRTTLDGSAVFEELESSVRTYCRRFPAVFARAHGEHLWDALMAAGRGFIA